MEIFYRKGDLVKYENVQYVNTYHSLSGPAQGPGNTGDCPGQRS